MSITTKPETASSMLRQLAMIMKMGEIIKLLDAMVKSCSLKLPTNMEAITRRTVLRTMMIVRGMMRLVMWNPFLSSILLNLVDA